MKKLLNTLFVTTESAYLHRDGETVRVEVEGETKLRVPLHTLDGIVCIGNILCSPHLMALCAKHNVKISFLSMYGKFQARVQGPVFGNVLLRREQYRRADDERESANIARAVVIGKIHNCRVVLQRALRDNTVNASQCSHEVETTENPPEIDIKNNFDKGDDAIVEGKDASAAVEAPFGDDGDVQHAKEKIQHTIKRLEYLLKQLQAPLPLDTLRGHEGDAARCYFSVFDYLITADPEDFHFKKRSRRPPLDNVNALLSFVYTLLVHDIESALEGVGLDPAVGYLHRDRPGRPGLALDLMEELRPYLADRLVLSLVNRQQIKGNGFRQTESGAVLMDDKSRKEVLVAWQKRKQEEITHPFLNEKIAIGLIPHVQALLLSRHLRGDLDGYPPFLWK